MSKEMCVLVYGDSLSMPRMTEGVFWSDLYVEKFRLWLEVQHQGVKVYLINRSRGSRRIPELYSDFESDYTYFDSNGEKILIIQGGVVDCAPRPIPDSLRFVISKFPSLLRRPVIKLLHDNRARLLQNGFKWRGTSPHVFRSVFQRWLCFAAIRFSRVYVLSILPTNEKTEAHSPGYGKSVATYNLIMQRVIRRMSAGNVFFVDLHAGLSAKPEMLGAVLNPKDGHHITAVGHEFYFQSLIEIEKTMVLQQVQT